MEFIPKMPLRSFFKDREDAGRAMADELKERYGAGNAVVFGIPRGGVQVAAPIAESLGVPLDVIVPRKIPIPCRRLGPDAHLS